MLFLVFPISSADAKLFDPVVNCSASVSQQVCVPCTCTEPQTPQPMPQALLGRSICDTQNAGEPWQCLCEPALCRGWHTAGVMGPGVSSSQGRPPAAIALCGSLYFWPGGEHQNTRPAGYYREMQVFSIFCLLFAYFKRWTKGCSSSAEH